MVNIILESVVQCPFCEFQQKEFMPEDILQYFYRCSNCNSLLKTQQGDCCVFCSYGSIKCTFVQKQQTT